MDLGHALKPNQSFPPASYGTSAGAAGATVDTKGFAEALIVLDSGTNGSSGTVDVTVQEDDGSNQWAAITGAAFTRVTEGNDNAIYAGRIALTPTRKRYLRAYRVVGTASCVFSVSILLGDAPQLPAATPAFNVYT